MNIQLRTEIFKEDDQFVALAPDLNVSSFGESVEDARASLKEAIAAFIEECENMGTLDEVLEESGFHKVGDAWVLRERVIEEELAVAI